MAAITSVKIGALEINDGVNYVALAPMASALEAGDPVEAVMLQMSRRPPVFVYAQPGPRVVPVVVQLLASTFTLRKAAYDTLLAACTLYDPGPLTWTAGTTTRTLMVVTSKPLIADTWFHRVSGEVTAPDPRAT